MLTTDASRYHPLPPELIAQCIHELRTRSRAFAERARAENSDTLNLARALYTSATVARTERDEEALRDAQEHFGTLELRLNDRRTCSTEEYASAILGTTACALAETAVQGEPPRANREIRLAIDLFEILEEVARERTFGGYLDLESGKNDGNPRKKRLSGGETGTKSRAANMLMLDACTHMHTALAAVYSDIPPISDLVVETISNQILVLTSFAMNGDFHFATRFTTDWTVIADDGTTAQDRLFGCLLSDALAAIGDQSLSRKFAQLIRDIEERAAGIRHSGDGIGTSAPGDTDNDSRGAECIAVFGNAWKRTGDTRWLAELERAVERTAGGDETDWLAARSLAALVS
jgi:hypothetical protein